MSTRLERWLLACPARPEEDATVCSTRQADETDLTTRAPPHFTTRADSDFKTRAHSKEVYAYRFGSRAQEVWYRV